MSDVKIWLVIAGLSVGTYLFRLSFLVIIGNRQLPEWLLRHLRYTAVAVLPALVAPMVVWPGSEGGEVSMVRIIAALIAIGIGIWRRSMVLTIIGGMLALYLLKLAGL